MNKASTVLVTGANGWLGSCVAHRFRTSGWQVRELTRQRSSTATEENQSIQFHLGGEVSQHLFDGVEALVHCAYDFGARKWEEIRSVNVDGSARLMETAHAAGVRRIVFISTMSAFPGCQSLYGRAKLATEERAAALGALILRPGLIYGEEPGGMFENLARQVRRSRWLPLAGGGKQMLYLIHQEDLVAYIHQFCRGDFTAPDQPITAAHSRGFTLREILEVLAKREGKLISFLPVPWRMVWLPLKIAELCGLRLNLRSDSVVSLVNQNTYPDFAGPAKLKFDRRTFSPELAGV